MAAVSVGDFKEHSMPSLVSGLFDRLGEDGAPSRLTRRDAAAHARDQALAGIMRDLQALLNSRTALAPSSLTPFPAVSGSIVNYGLIDFAGMCMNSDTDQQEICTAVRLAIERHEPRLREVVVTLTPRKGSINRVDFVIHARLKDSALAEPMAFNAVFRPSLQQYSIEGMR